MVDEFIRGDRAIVLDFKDGGSLPAHLLRRLDEIAESQRDTFNALMADLTTGREHNIDWWVSRPASRNTHSSSLFTQCIRLALVRSLLDEGIRPLVESDSSEMAAILQPVLGNSHVVLGDRTWRRRLHATLWNIGSAVFHTLGARLAARRTRRNVRPAPDSPISVLETFAYRDSFNSGVFKDFHYPALYESLNGEQRKRLYYLPLFYRLRNYTAYFRELRQSNRNFLLREDYLRWSDYLFAFMHWWRVGKLKGRRARFAGFEVGPLVDADLEDGRFANSTIQALLSYRFWRMARSGLIVDRYIDWYEGHDLDHAVAAAINWHVHVPKLITLRPIAPESYLSVTPARHEVACGVVSPIWGVIGKRVREQIAHDNPQLHVLPAPGLRHMRLGQFERRYSRNEIPAIVILLSQEMDLANRLLATVGPLLRTNSSYRWLVKRHPGMPKAEVEAAVAAHAEGVELVEGDLYDWLAQAAVIIGMGSNTLIEAAAAGIPIICASSGNEPTELPFSTSFKFGWWSMCYDSTELMDLIPRAIAAGREEVSAQDLREALLGPFDVDAMHSLLFAPLPAGASTDS